MNFVFILYVAFYIYSFYVGTQNPRGSPSEVIMWIKAFSVVPGPPSILSHCFFSALQVGVVLVPYRALDETWESWKDKLPYISGVEGCCHVCSTAHRDMVRKGKATEAREQRATSIWGSGGQEEWNWAFLLMASEDDGVPGWCGIWNQSASSALTSLKGQSEGTLLSCDQASKGGSILQWQWLLGSGLGTWVQTLWPSESLREEAVQGQGTAVTHRIQRTPGKFHGRVKRNQSFHPEAKGNGCEHYMTARGAELDHPSHLGRGTPNPRRPQEVQRTVQSLKASLAMWLREGKSQLCSLRRARDSWQSSLIEQASGALLGRYKKLL